MFEGYYDMGRENTMEGVFYLFAFKLLGSPGFAYIQSNRLGWSQNLKSEAKLCSGGLTLW